MSYVKRNAVSRTFLMLRSSYFLKLLFIVSCLPVPIFAVSDTDSPSQLPFETVRGFYYFTDQGLYAERPDPSLPFFGNARLQAPSASTRYSAQKPAPSYLFDEDLHEGAGIDFHNQLVLSFDDVVFDDSLDRTLDILAAHKIKAIFFLTAVHIGEADRSLVRRRLERMIRDGHELGNHSYGHPELDRGKFADGKHDLQDTLDEFRSLETTVNKILGRQYPFRYLRPPFGIRGNSGDGLGARLSLPGRVDEACGIMGRKLILWHINSLDFTMAYDTTSRNYLSSSQVVAACVDRIYASTGGVVLFHANKRLPRVLDAILSGLDRKKDDVAKAYGFTSIDELLAIKYGPVN